MPRTEVGSWDPTWTTHTAASTTFTLYQLKKNIQTELEQLPPFHVARQVLHAEIDQIDDMLDRRR